MVRRFAAIFAMSIAAAAALPASPVTAAEGCGVAFSCTTNYYSSSTYTTLVGQRFVECDGTETRWGTNTVWKKVTSSAC